MTYHSDTLAFKKSELLKILQEIDSSFSFEQNLNYKDTFFKYDTFNGFEVACLISGYNPDKLTIGETRKVAWRNENPKFVQALNLVMSVDIEQGIFRHDEGASCYECEYIIKNEDLKKYLMSKNIFINGFNDIRQNQIQYETTPEQSSFDNPSIQQLPPDIEELSTENARLKTELTQAQERIKQLESEQQSNISQSDLLDLIFDETAQDRYAPDLALSIKLWEDLYINNPKNDSHKNKSDTWIKKHTPYTNESSVEVKRLREVTSPFQGWHIDRKNKFNNK